jgi:nucleoside-diphosphate-sugar epimerase
MRVLVLGGTQFLGRHVVDAALAHGHDITLFNRGQTRPELFPEVQKNSATVIATATLLPASRLRCSGRHERLRPAHRRGDDRRARRRRPLRSSSISVYADGFDAADRVVSLGQLKEPTEDRREATAS